MTRRPCLFRRHDLAGRRAGKFKPERATEDVHEPHPHQMAAEAAAFRSSFPWHWNSAVGKLDASGDGRIQQEPATLGSSNDDSPAYQRWVSRTLDYGVR